MVITLCIREFFDEIQSERVVKWMSINRQIMHLASNIVTPKSMYEFASGCYEARKIDIYDVEMM
jgi:hypothetical protein